MQKKWEDVYVHICPMCEPSRPPGMDPRDWSRLWVGVRYKNQQTLHLICQRCGCLANSLKLKNPIEDDDDHRWLTGVRVRQRTRMTEHKCATKMESGMSKPKQKAIRAPNLEYGCGRSRNQARGRGSGGGVAKGPHSRT
jgi:hypothetical protein